MVHYHAVCLTCGKQHPCQRKQEGLDFLHNHAGHNTALLKVSRWRQAVRAFRHALAAVGLGFFGLRLEPNADVKIAQAASSALTISLASLATSATFVAGQESTAVDNTSNKYLDYLLSGKIEVGTTPTINTQILVYVVGILEDSTWPDVFDGTDSNETVTSAGVRDGFCKLAASMFVDATTSNRDYFFGPVSVARLFGDRMPNKFVVFVTHNTGANLNATGGNHSVWITPKYLTVA